MEPSPSPDGPERVTAGDVGTLFLLADAAVRAGLAGQAPPEVRPDALTPALREPAGVFVTLDAAGGLNGCVGAVAPVEPLGPAVPRLAWTAAFADPRMPSLTAADYPSLEIKLSLLSALTPLGVATESELAAMLRPGVDGVMIRRGTAQATFLPAVWQTLPDPVRFLRHLEAKAGLRPGAWPPGAQAWRYTTTEHRRRASKVGRSPAGDSPPLTVRGG
jgi:AmmeMemoRadiSam system protein A